MSLVPSCRCSWRSVGAALLLALAVAAAVSAPAAAGDLATATGTFTNPGLFIEVEQPFDPVTLSRHIINGGESMPSKAYLRVFSTVPYVLEVSIASPADVDLAGSQLKPGVDPRDVFTIRIGDEHGNFTAPQPGSAVVQSAGMPPTIGNGGTVHVVELRMRFADGGTPLFEWARPGDYTATLTFEAREAVMP